MKPSGLHVARAHGKVMGVGGVRQGFRVPELAAQARRAHLTGGSDVGYILSAGRADVKQLRELRL